MQCNYSADAIRTSPFDDDLYLLKTSVSSLSTPFSVYGLDEAAVRERRCSVGLSPYRRLPGEAMIQKINKWSCMHVSVPFSTTAELTRPKFLRLMSAAHQIPATPKTASTTHPKPAPNRSSPLFTTRTPTFPSRICIVNIMPIFSLIMTRTSSTAFPYTAFLSSPDIFSTSSSLAY